MVEKKVNLQGWKGTRKERERQLLSLSSWFCLIIGGIFLVTSFFQPQIFLGNIILNLKPTGIYIFVVGAFSLLIYYLSK